MPTRRPAAPRRLIAALAASLLLVACSPGPTTAPTASSPAETQAPPVATPGTSAPPAAEVYGEIRQAVEAIRGLEPVADVDPVTIDEAQLRSNLAAEFDKENKPADVKFSEESLSLLGLLPAGTSLRQATLDFQGGQVAGYYSPDQKELFVVSRSGSLGAAEKVTYAHEFTHQLQDQNFPLLGLLGSDASQSDRTLARLAVIEGDAVSVQTAWTIANLNAREMGELLAASLDPEAVDALRRAPAYLRETALFPYQNGFSFVESLISSGGYKAVNGALGDAPDSTEQVLHPEKFVQREPPVQVALAGDVAKTMGIGWSEAGRDTLGEFVLRLWLTQNGVPTAIATAAATGWGGDRLVLLRGPSGGLTVGLRTEWDTAADAAAFASASATAIAHLGSGAATRHRAGSKTVILAIGDGADRLVPALGG